MQLVLGDALAVALIEARGFSSHSFGLFHPGGRLGAQLTTLEKVMGTDEALPRVTLDATLRSATIEMSRKRYGCTAVIDESGKLTGVFTDGDLRRHLAEGDGVLDQPLAKVMTRKPICLREDALAADAIHIFNERNIDDLVIINAKREPIGLVDSQDLPKLKAV